MLALLVVGLVLFAKNKNNTSTYYVRTEDPAVIAKQYQKRYSRSYNEELSHGNYESYQNSRLREVDLYLRKKDYKAAKVVLSDILKKVPSDKITTTTYMRLCDIALEEKDTAAYGQYAPSLINKLNQEGRKTEANLYSAKLKAQG